MPAVRRPLGRRGHGRAVPGSRPDASDRRRPATGQQRRRRQQLRDAGARQAGPHVRCGGGPRWPAHRPPGSRGRAARDARPRRARADDRDLGHRRPRWPVGHRRGDGRRGVGGLGRDDGRRRRVGHLRPGEHPADSVPLRLALRGEPALREGPGASTGQARRRSHGPAHHRMGRRHGRDRCRRHEPDRASQPPRSRSARRGSIACWARRWRPASSATCSIGSASRRARPRPGRASSSPARRRRWSSTPAMPRSWSRPSRRGAATCSSKPTSPRRSRASAATRPSPRSCPTRRCRRTVRTRSGCATPSARRWSARA